ncbi:sodium:alanine symporter family protein [bacterium]|nr:sodium:alanine symporter family protein [bacterium]
MPLALNFSYINDLFLDYVAVFLIFFLGSYFTLKSRFLQITGLPKTARDLVLSPQTSKAKSPGTHPLKVFFASVGGMIGIGNVVAVATAVQIGGPGALFWVWMAALVGSLIKYSEIYLGHKYRVPNAQGGFDGGPMYFLRHAYQNRWVPILICILLCIYGTEVYQFSVIVDSVTSNWSIERIWVVPVFLGLVIYAGWGGVNRVGAVCASLLPLFSILYVLMSGYIFLTHLEELPSLLKVVLQSAFTGHAAMGGFAGSTALMAIQQGLIRAAYSADIGIGYDSIIQSESRITESHRQARFAILGVFLDSFMCTCSVLLILVTGVWNQSIPA